MGTVFAALLMEEMAIAGIAINAEYTMSEVSMEQRLVDANALVQAINRRYCSNCNNYNGILCRACHIQDALDMIDDAPTVDTKPVQRYQVKLICPTNGASCNECIPGAPCAIRKKG